MHSFTVTIVVLIIVIVIAYVSDDLKKSGTLDIGTETDVEERRMCPCVDGAALCKTGHPKTGEVLLGTAIVAVRACCITTGLVRMMLSMMMNVCPSGCIFSADSAKACNALPDMQEPLDMSTETALVLGQALPVHVFDPEA